MRNLIIFVAAFVATLLSSMSGGGAGIILLPVALSLGFPYPLVAATFAVNSTLWVLPAARNYLKGRTVHRSLVGIFSLIGLAGCYLGVLFVTDINQRKLEICAGSVILFLVVYTYFRRGLGLREQKIYSRARQAVAYPFALILGFYEIVFGAGNGILSTTLFSQTFGFDFIDGLAHYYIISFSWALFAAILFIHRGYYNVPMMVCAAAGSVLGAYLGSRYARNKGNKFIKILFIAIGGLLGTKLLLGW